MSTAKARLAQFKKRMEKINQIDARLQFTQKQMEQRRKLYNQEYLVIPPYDPNSTSLRPQVQSRASGRSERYQGKKISTLNTDFYKRTIFPETNVSNPTATNNEQNAQVNTSIVQNTEPMVIQEPQKKHRKQPAQTTNMINEDKLQTTSNPFLKLIPVQQTAAQNQQSVPLQIKPRETPEPSNKNLFNKPAPINLFNNTVNTESKGLFSPKKVQITSSQVPKELGTSKSQEKAPQTTSLFGNKNTIFEKPTSLFGKPSEPADSNKTPSFGFNFTNNQQNNNREETIPLAPVMPNLFSAQPPAPQNMIFNTNNAQDNNSKVKKPVFPLSRTTSLFAKKQASKIQTDPGQTQRQTQTEQPRPGLFSSSQEVNKSFSLFQNKNSSQETKKIQNERVQEKQGEIKGGNTPIFEVEGQNNSSSVAGQAQNKISTENIKQTKKNQEQNNEQKSQPKKLQIQENKQEVKYPQIDSPILQLKNPQQIQLPKPTQQVRKESEPKQTSKAEMLGPKGKTIQVLPFFGNAGKPLISSGETTPFGSFNKPVVNNPPSGNTASSLFQNLGTNPTSNLFQNANTGVSLFGNPLANASSNAFSQQFLNRASTGGLFGGQTNSLFSQTGTRSLFTGQNTGTSSLFSGQNTGSLFGNANQNVSPTIAQNRQDEDQSGEGDDQPLEAQQNFNPQLSTGKYDYLQTNILFKEPIIKFRKGRGQLLENITVSLEQFPEKSDVYLFVRLANKVIGFSGMIVRKVTEIRVLNNSVKNIQVMKILECGQNVGENAKAELCLLRLQFKDEQSGQRFKQEFEKAIKASS